MNKKKKPSSNCTHEIYVWKCTANMRRAKEKLIVKFCELEAVAPKKAQRNKTVTILDSMNGSSRLHSSGNQATAHHFKVSFIKISVIRHISFYPL